jgi:hypothetical protein
MPGKGGFRSLLDRRTDATLTQYDSHYANLLQDGVQFTAAALAKQQMFFDLLNSGLDRFVHGVQFHFVVGRVLMAEKLHSET